MTATLASPQLLYTVDDLVASTGLSETTIRDCIKGRSTTYPPLQAKRIKKTGSAGAGRLYVTRQQAEAWLAAFPDA